MSELMRPVYLTSTQYLMLELHLMDGHKTISPSAFVSDLVGRWLAKEQARLEAQGKGRGLMGYQWKDVFLPDGTALRTNDGGVSRFAQVRGQHIVFDGASVSPSQFVNGTGPNRGRSAWRYIWLRFPDHEHWERAADHRKWLTLQSKPSKTC